MNEKMQESIDSWKNKFDYIGLEHMRDFIEVNIETERKRVIARKAQDEALGKGPPPYPYDYMASHKIGTTLVIRHLIHLPKLVKLLGKPAWKNELDGLTFIILIEALLGKPEMELTGIQLARLAESTKNVLDDRYTWQALDAKIQEIFLSVQSWAFIHARNDEIPVMCFIKMKAEYLEAVEGYIKWRHVTKRGDMKITQPVLQKITQQAIEGTTSFWPESTRLG